MRRVQQCCMSGSSTPLRGNRTADGALNCRRRHALIAARKHAGQVDEHSQHVAIQ